MGGIVDLIFGGSDDSAQSAQIQANDAQIALQQRLADQARGDVTRIIPIADENRNLGFQAALDVFGQGTGQQLDVFQQGNVGAQQAALAGVPQFQNAILGRPTDLSGLQAQQLNFDPSFLNQILPDFFTGVTDQSGAGGAAGATAAGGLGGAASNTFLNNIAAFIQQNNPDGGGGGASTGNPGSVGSAASNFNTALDANNFLNSPLGVFMAMAVPGGGLFSRAGSMASNQTIANALGVDTSFFDGLFGEGDAAAAANALGLTTEDFMSLGVAVNNANSIQTRDQDRFGPPSMNDGGGSDFSGDFGGDGGTASSSGDGTGPGVGGF